MIRSKVIWHLLACALLLCILAVSSYAQTVAVRFYSQEQLTTVSAPVPNGMSQAEAAIRYLVAGPTQAQAALGITSAIPAGVTLEAVILNGDCAQIDMSVEVTSGLNEYTLQAIFEQFKATLGDYPEIKQIRLTSDGKPLSSYLTPVATIPSLPKSPSAPAPNAVGLTGKRVAVGPSHGRFWNGSGWYWMRSDPCAFGEPVLEDTNSIRLVQYLKQYLIQDGAEFICPRQLDESDGNHPVTGMPWWKMCAQSWLQHCGVPSSIWANSSGNTGEDPIAGLSRSSDDIRARPLWADHNNADIYIAHHTNAGGAGTATGTETFRDTTMDHQEHVANSLSLASSVQSSVISTIRSTYNEEPAWADRGVKDSAGGFGEIRIPNRPAILIELAFHDDCTRDALYLKDNFFRSVAEWAIYKGICTYFGNTPTWDKYSCEYISDNIPETMVPGQVYNVSVTLRNRGVSWFSTRGFKLAATANNDSWFRAVPSVSSPDNVGPGDTCTLNFQLTGPSVGGVRTTEWRMVREGFSTGFGPTITKVVDSGTVVDNDPPTVPQNLRMASNTISTISLAWDASTDAVTMVEGYTVYRDGVAIATVTGTGFTDTGRSRGVVHTYEVDAFDSFNNRSAKSSSLEAQVIVDNDPPTVPANLRMAANSSSSISIAWDASTDAGTGLAGYTVYRNGVALGNVTGTTFNDTGLVQNTTYTYEVDAYDVYLNRSVKSVPLDAATLADDVPPTAPQNLRTTAVTYANVALAWDASTDNLGVTGYTVYRDGVSIATTTALTYNDTASGQSSTHTYEVDAYDQASNHSAKSNAIVVSTPILATWGPFNMTQYQCIYRNSSGGGSQTANLRTGCYSGDGQIARSIFKASNANMATMPAQALCAGGTFTVAEHGGTYGSTAIAHNIYRITTPWTAGSATTYAAGAPWTNAGGDFVGVGTATQNVGNPPDGTVFTWNVAGTNAWFPFGVMLKSNSETLLSQRKGWTGTSPASTLRVNYVPPTPTIRTWAYLGHYAQGGSGDHVTRINTDHVAGTYNGVPVTEANIAPGAADGVSGADFGNTFGAFKWKTATATDDVVNLLTAPFYNVPTNDNGATYAACYVYRSTPTGNVYMGIGSDDDVKVYVNGTLRGSFVGASGRGAVADQDFYGPFSLPSGWSRLLVKVENGIGGYGLYARFANADRTAVEGITTYASDATAPTSPAGCTEAGGAISDAWQHAVSAPSFTWSGAGDPETAGEGVSGVRGYKVYFGADPAGVPATFQSGATFAPGSVADGVYYLRVATVDYALNESAVATVFTFKKNSVVASSKAAADGSAVMMDPAIVTAIVPGGFYMEDLDRTAGIKVISAAPVEVNQLVLVEGTLGTDSNFERQIAASSVTAGLADVIAPFVLTNKAIGGTDWNYNALTGAGQRGVIDGVGLNNIGLLIRTNGYVAAVGSDYFIINDGSEARGGSVVNGVRVSCPGMAKPAVGQNVIVTGISTIHKVQDSLYRCILVTNQAQISMME